MRKIRVFYDKWAFIARQNSSMRKAVRIAATEKINLKKLKLLRSVFESMVSVLIGKSSTKHAIAKRRILKDQVRRDLISRYHSLGMII